MNDPQCSLPLLLPPFPSISLGLVLLQFLFSFFSFIFSSSSHYFLICCFRFRLRPSPRCPNSTSRGCMTAHSTSACSGAMWVLGLIDSYLCFWLPFFFLPTASPSGAGAGFWALSLASYFCCRGGDLASCDDACDLGVDQSSIRLVCVRVFYHYSLHVLLFFLSVSPTSDLWMNLSFCLPLLSPCFALSDLLHTYGIIPFLLSFMLIFRGSLLVLVAAALFLSWVSTTYDLFYTFFMLIQDPVWWLLLILSVFWSAVPHITVSAMRRFVWPSNKHVRLGSCLSPHSLLPSVVYHNSLVAPRIFRRSSRSRPCLRSFSF